MKIKEIYAKTVLSPSQVYDYAVNPYTGCQHACTYCYARFMKRFSGHKESWGDFVDVKINAPDILQKEIKKKKKGTVWLSGVCDPYQPLEATYALSRKCLEILIQNNWPVFIKYGWNDKNTDDYFNRAGRKISNECKKLGVDCRSAYH